MASTTWFALLFHPMWTVDNIGTASGECLELPGPPSFIDFHEQSPLLCLGASITLSRARSMPGYRLPRCPSIVPQLGKRLLFVDLLEA